MDQSQNQKIKYHVLFISGSVCWQGILKDTFEKAGYIFHSTIYALDAWENLQNGFECDVIWCCTELPKMDIIELFNLVKNDDRFKDIPFFALANRSHFANIINYNLLVRKMVGIEYFFTKPPLEDSVIEATGEAILGFR
ncbi:MAG: response regulator [Nostocales cyanobacterium]|nr:MAG: response regulator [Nostocales cyanobacterium]